MEKLYNVIPYYMMTSFLLPNLHYKITRYGLGSGSTELPKKMYGELWQRGTKSAAIHDWEDTYFMWLFYGRLLWPWTLYEPISGYQMIQVNQKPQKSLAASFCVHIVNGQV